MSEATASWEAVAVMFCLAVLLALYLSQDDE